MSALRIASTTLAAAVIIAMASMYSACSSESDRGAPAGQGSDAETGNDDAAIADASAGDSATGDGACAPWDSDPGDAAALGTCSPDATAGAPAYDTQLDGGALAGLHIHGNLTYAMRGGRTLQGDLAFDDAAVAAKRGVLVAVHGGGFVDCTRRRDAVGTVAAVWARAFGVATFNVEYRLVQEGGVFPNGLMDVKCAVQWIGAHASDYGLDGSKLAIIGESAGATHAASVALTADRDDLDPHCGPSAPRVAAAITVSGAYDFPSLRGTSDVGNAAAVFGSGSSCVDPVGACSTERTCDRCTDMSPLAHACGKLPKLFVVHAADPNDPLIPEKQAQSFFDRLVAGSADAKLRITKTDEMAALADCPDPKVAHGFSPCILPLIGGDIGDIAKSVLY